MVIEKDWETEEVEKKINRNVWDVVGTCTKSCQEAYNSYEKNGLCPHYLGSFFKGMMLGPLNRWEMESKKCVDVVWEICDLFKKDETEWK